MCRVSFTIVREYILDILHAVAITRPVQDGTRRWCLLPTSNSHQGGRSPIPLNPMSVNFAALVLRGRRRWPHTRAFTAETVRSNALPAAKCFGMSTACESTYASNMVVLCRSPMRKNTTTTPLTRAKRDSASSTATPALYRSIVWIYLNDIKSKRQRGKKGKIGYI